MVTLLTLVIKHYQTRTLSTWIPSVLLERKETSYVGITFAFCWKEFGRCHCFISQRQLHLSLTGDPC